MCREAAQGRRAAAAGPADGLDFCVAALHAFAREHVMTRSFLRQLVLDVERNGVDAATALPALAALPPDLARGPHAIPLLARSAVSRHEAVPPPLPGRLPRGCPQPAARTGCAALTDCGIAGFGRIREIESDATAAAAAGRPSPHDDGDDDDVLFPDSAGRHKRRRRRRSADTSPRDSHDSPVRWAYPGLSTDPSESSSSRSTPPESHQDASSASSSYPDPHTAAATGFLPSVFTAHGHGLPHRSNSPAVASAPMLGYVGLLPPPPTPGGMGDDDPSLYTAAADVASAWAFLGTTASATTVDWNAIYTTSSGFDPGPPVAEGGAAATTTTTP